MKPQKPSDHDICPLSRCIRRDESARKRNQIPRAQSSRPSEMPMAYRPLAESARMARPSVLSG